MHERYIFLIIFSYHSGTKSTFLIIYILSSIVFFLTREAFINIHREKKDRVRTYRVNTNRVHVK